MNHIIKIGMFGLGWAGREVAEQLLNDPSVMLSWVVRGGNTGLD